MRTKTWIVGALIAGLLGTCALGLAIAYWTVQAAGARLRPEGSNLASTSTTETQSFPISDAARLEVINFSGDITISVAADDTLEVTAVKTGWGSDVAAAEAELAKVNVVITQTGDTIRLETKTPVGLINTPAHVDVALTFRVPRRTSVDVTTGQGRVSLNGTTGSALLHSDFGDVSAETVTGTVQLSSSSGSVVASHIEAGAQDLELKTDFGSIDIADTTSAGVVLTSQSGRIDIRDVTATSDLKASTEFGDITLNASSGARIDLKSSSGSIEAQGVSGPIKAFTDFGDVTVNASGPTVLDLHTSSGAVTFEGTLGEGSHSITSDFGPVSLILPETTRVSIDLSTDFGQVTSALPVTLGSGGSSRDLTGGTLVGTVNGGGSPLVVHTSSGDIELRVQAP